MTANPTTPAPPGQQSLPRNVRVLGLVSLVNDIASEAIYPQLPRFLLLTVLRDSHLSLGFIEGAADSVASLVKLWSGGRSDQIGRRKGFVVFGYSLANVVRPLLGVVSAAWQVFLIRVADRIGKGVRTAPRDALIADSTDPSIRGRAFGFHRAMDHLGAAIGPLLAAGFLLAFPNSLSTLFLLTGLPGLLVIALVVFGVRETTATGPAREPVRLTLRPFDGNFRLFLVTLAVFTLGNSSDVFLLVRAGELGVSVPLLSILWCIFHIAKSTSNLLLGRAVDRFGTRPFLFLGWFLYAGVYLGFGLATEVWHAWGLFLSYALFYGLTEPAEKTLVAALAGSERKGLAYGWYNFAIGICTLPASLLFGALYQKVGPLAAFGSGAGLALLAAGLLVGVRERREPGVS